jgi:hypothetical protein
MRTQGKPATSALQAPPESSGMLDGSNGTGSAVVDAVVGGVSLMQTRTKHVMAVKAQVPRVLAAVEARVLEEADRMGEDFFYAWEVNDKLSPTGKSLIKGMSIEGALILLRNWGNCTCEVEIVEDAPNHWVLQSTFIDFEQGFQLPRLYRQRKGERHGKFDADRALDIAFQIGQSKAQRNAIDKGMPSWLKHKAMEKATEATINRYKDVEASVAKFVAYAKNKLGVSADQLQAKIGKPFAKWKPEDCVLLAGVMRAIRDNEVSLADAFPPIVIDTTAEVVPTTAPTAPAAPEQQTPAAAPPPPQSKQPSEEEQAIAAAAAAEAAAIAAAQQQTAPADRQQTMLGEPGPAPAAAAPTPTRRRSREPGDD